MSVNLILSTQKRCYNLSATNLNMHVRLAYGYNTTKQPRPGQRFQLDPRVERRVAIMVVCAAVGSFFVGRESGSRGVGWSADVTYQASG